jgi:hypothetical protein
VRIYLCFQKREFCNCFVCFCPGGPLLGKQPFSDGFNSSAKGENGKENKKTGDIQRLPKRRPA